MSFFSFSRTKPKVEVLLGDLILRDTDAIVNAADDSMLGGTGVDGAIREAGGPELSAACRAVGRLRGRAVATPGFRLPARWVIHVAAPVRGTTGDAADLAPYFGICLKKAREMHLKSIAFPLLGAGAFGWDGDEAAEAAKMAVEREGRGSLERIVFVAFSQSDFEHLCLTFDVEGQRTDEARVYHAGAL